MSTQVGTVVERLTLRRLATAAVKEWPDDPSEQSAHRVTKTLTREQLGHLVELQLIDEIEDVKWATQRRSLISMPAVSDEGQAERRAARWADARRLSPADRQTVLADKGVAEYNAQFGVGSIIAVFKDDLALELTPELLSTSFKVEGRAVTFGSATVSDHEARMHLLIEHAKGLLETYRYHEAAVAMLVGHDAECLNDVAAKAAA